MKRIKLLIGFLVALIILSGMSAPTVSAQALDGVWLKCKVNVKGATYDFNGGVYSKENGSIPAYLNFTWSNDHYIIKVWTNPNGTWLKTYTISRDSVRPGENFITHFYLRFVFSGSDYIETYHTPFITYHYKNNMVDKVTYKGTGEVYNGSVGGGLLNYFGYFNISGTSVPTDKLPPDIIP
jgi:hypothetical protein